MALNFGSVPYRGGSRPRLGRGSSLLAESHNKYYSILNDEFSEANGYIFMPAFAEFTTMDIHRNLQIMHQRGVKFPVVCKPTLAHGKMAHQLTVIFKSEDLKYCKPPCVVQSFVNHNAVLHKIYLVGNRFSPRLPNPGETIHGTKFTQSYGGKGANQCVAAAKLGANTSMICRLGDDQWGHSYKAYLKELGVDVSHVIITPNEPSGIAQIFVANNGENQIVIVPGANSKLSPEDVETSAELIRSAEVLIAQLETPFITTLTAFKLNHKIKILNAAPALNNIEEILPYTTILCVNESEASMLANVEVNSTAKAIEALKILIETGCETVIITMGDQGAVYLTKDEMVPTFVYCDQVVPVDTTGAGDAFVGALATFITSHKNYPLHQQIGAACEVATFSVTKEGTQTSYPVDFITFSKQYQYKIL